MSSNVLPTVGPIYKYKVQRGLNMNMYSTVAKGQLRI